VSLIGEIFGLTISYWKPTEGCSPAFAVCIGDCTRLEITDDDRAFINTYSSRSREADWDTKDFFSHRRLGWYCGEELSSGRALSAFEGYMDLSDDPINDWVHQPIPEKLWHYTSVQGFQGIVESGSIYATDVRFLNDTEEFIHIRKLADDLVENAPEIGEFQYPLRFNLKWVVKAIFGSDFLNPNSAQIFVASFTTSEDDLSQWRGYSHGTYGVSISFDLRTFRPPLDSGSAVTFAPCIYDDGEKKKIIQHALDYFVRESQTSWVNALRDFLKDVTGKARPSFDQITAFTNSVFGSEEFKAQQMVGLIEARKRILRLAGLLKHRAFHHEREWRLVLPISPVKDKTNLIHPIRFRPSAVLVPYIAFPLGVVPSSSDPAALPTAVLPINDVILGPGTRKDAESAAQAFLKSNSINVAPRLSDVPYRQV